MEPPVLFLIKEISSFSTRSSVLFDILSQLLPFFHFNSSFPLFEYIFPLLYMFYLKFFLLRAIDMSLIIIVKISISNY